jgi:uncharacterized membrane protein
MLLLCAFLLGFVAGLRSMLAPAVASWAACLNRLNVSQTPVVLMSYKITAIVFTILAAGELVADKLPMTPSRKQPLPFIIRIVTGSLVGATVGATAQKLLLGLVLGAIGAVAGTLGGAAVRAKLASVIGRDLPAAIIEDIAALAIAIFSVLVLG